MQQSVTATRKSAFPYKYCFQSNRVTLKMDVSHTEHSHVIGKGGNNIKKVMLDTGCHIHFPDSNRGINVQEKSNQVSAIIFSCWCITVRVNPGQTWYSSKSSLLANSSVTPMDRSLIYCVFLRGGGDFGCYLQFFNFTDHWRLQPVG